MAEPPAVQPPEEARPLWKACISAFFKQIVIFYIASSFLKGYFSPSSTNTTVNGVSVGAASNIFMPNQLYDIYFYLDENEKPSETYHDSDKLLWSLKSLRYGDWNGGPDGDGSYIFQATFPTPEFLIRNQSIYLHSFLTKSGNTINPADEKFNKNQVVHRVTMLNKFKKKFYKKTSNLLTGKSEQSEEDLAKAETMKFEVLNFWHPNISVNLVDDQTAWTKGAIPPQISDDIVFTQDGKFYQPILFFNTFWNLNADYMPINETVKQLNISITFYPVSMFKYQMYASQKQQSRWEAMLPGDSDDDGQDSLKQAFLETNPILLAITMLVSVLHSVFEFLAFKNDIQFWRERKDLAGLSVRSVLFNIFQSVIVFLYICDNETNFVVKCSVGVGLLIECWKIPKVVDLKIDREDKLLGIIPKIRFSDKGSYVESDTKIYDEMAFRYLSFALFPLLIGYSIYSVMYNEHKGWYSWVLNMLYGYLLTFGFITMTPQLFINYKLKSVAHLPWRMLTYKFINTFIDDLFAFVIKMPFLYRIGVFRDDIIFLIYVYQRWIYRVDPTRLNEYGTSLEKETDQTKQVETKKTQ